MRPESECIDVGHPDTLYNDPDGSQCDLGALSFTGPPFVCGDTDDDGSVNILDITLLINYLYLEGPAPVHLEAADVNSSGAVNILDITFLIGFLYQDGPEPYCQY